MFNDFWASCDPQNYFDGLDLGAIHLCLGSTDSAAVKIIQRALNQLKILPQPLTEDGQFGQQTEEAVRLFQQQSGLPVDGIVGALTLAVMRQSPVTRSIGQGITEELQGEWDHGTTTYSIVTGSLQYAPLKWTATVEVTVDGYDPPHVSRTTVSGSFDVRSGQVTLPQRP